MVFLGYTSTSWPSAHCKALSLTHVIADICPCFSWGQNSVAIFLAFGRWPRLASTSIWSSPMCIPAPSASGLWKSWVGGYLGYRGSLVRATRFVTKGTANWILGPSMADIWGENFCASSYVNLTLTPPASISDACTKAWFFIYFYFLREFSSTLAGRGFECQWLQVETMQQTCATGFVKHNIFC